MRFALLKCFEKCNEAHEVKPQLSELQIALQSIWVAMIDDVSTKCTYVHTHIMEPEKGAVFVECLLFICDCIRMRRALSLRRGC